MKKILIFSLAYYPHVGGAEVAIKEITDRIPEVEWHMLTLRFDAEQAREEKMGNIFIHRIGGGASKLAKLWFEFAAAHKAAELHREHHFDAAWAMMAHSAGVPAALFSRIHPEVPFLLTLQEGDPLSQIERTMLPLWPWFTQAFTRAAAVQAISTFLADWARKRGAQGPIEVIPNGVDLTRFSGEPVAHEGTILITASRLVHKNAIDDVIRALPLLPAVRFRIFGTGPQEQGLKALTQELGVANRIEFRGHIDHAQLPRELRAADIFIRPSRSEGMGNSFIEAMAAGLPVIATQQGGIADFLFDAKRDSGKEATGFAVDANSPEQIAAAVKEILANPEETKRVTEAAKRLVIAQYDWDTVARRMHALFATIAA